MADDIETVERFPAGTTEDEIQREAELKKTAGASSSVYSGSEQEGWTLTTLWPPL